MKHNRKAAIWSPRSLGVMLWIASLIGCSHQPAPQQHQPPTPTGTAVAPTPQPPTSPVKPPPAPVKVAAYVEVTSTPEGGQVTLGHPIINGVSQLTNGRPGGVTPCKIELKSSDVNSMGGITIQVEKSGYLPSVTGLSDGAKKITAGGGYQVSVTLKKP